MTWKKAGSLEPLTIGEMSFAQRTDYEVHHMDPHWNLLIKNVQLEHAGIYECHVSTKDKMKRVVQLNVVGNYSFMCKHSARTLFVKLCLLLFSSETL